MQTSWQGSDRQPRPSEMDPAGGPLMWYHTPNWIRHPIVPSGKWSCEAALAGMNDAGEPDVVILGW